jgi:adenine-specific DNA-methyltransferase
MPDKKPTAKPLKSVEALTHEEASRKNIPTAEYQSLVQREYQDPLKVAYERRNRDLDPQLVWRGKDQQDWSDLVVNAPPIYVQEKVHPKFLIDDLMRRRESKRAGLDRGDQFDLFADFNGLPDTGAKTEFYQHDAHWSNRMILGDSLQVMASLDEREGLRGKVQCIYFDPPYGIKFNSNFQWSTTSRDVKDGDRTQITREPEQVKAFRDTWRDGIHSYLTYLRDRLTVARDLLTESGSIFVQIGDENVHRVRSLLDQVFGEDNFCSTINVTKTGSQSGELLSNISDTILWYAKSKDLVKFRKFFLARPERSDESVSADPALSSGFRTNTSVPLTFRGKIYDPGKSYNWKTYIEGMHRLAKADRLVPLKSTLRYGRLYQDFPVKEASNIWSDLAGATDLIYVVQTATKIVQRCLLMATDPGDLVLDPTCGSGTTAYVAEQWGRRWITIDTSRVALALARARIMGARYPYYLLADSREGQTKEAEVNRTIPASRPTQGDLRQGFVYERVPHITLKSIANNAEIDVIWDKFQQKLEPLREQLNRALKQQWEEWQIPREAEDRWPAEAKALHRQWWEQRIARQKEIDASIAAKADTEYLYDKPYEDKSKVRVAGPFTVESLSPHRVLGVDENDELIDGQSKAEVRDFAQMILENLRTAGVQQAHKEDKITFSSLKPWPGTLIGAEGLYEETGADATTPKRAAIFIGPEFGTVSRPDLVDAAREAADSQFNVLIACAFSFDAHCSNFSKLGAMPVLKARMNADLHMAEDLKNTGKGNLFVIFGEPDIDVLRTPDGQYQVKIKGVDVFHPATGEIRSDGPDGIACWFLDTDYNEESFFVRHAYFLGANDPYKALKTTLKAEVDEEAWESLHSDTSRPFGKPESGRIAVKVINHLGDEVMKVFRVG